MPDDEQQELLDYAREVCPSCGNLREVCSSKDTVWFPQRSTCYASAAREVTLRTLREKYRADADQPKPGKFHDLDGLSVWVSTHDLSPDDQFV